MKTLFITLGLLITANGTISKACTTEEHSQEHSQEHSKEETTELSPIKDPGKSMAPTQDLKTSETVIIKTQENGEETTVEYKVK